MWLGAVGGGIPPPPHLQLSNLLKWPILITSVAAYSIFVAARRQMQGNLGVFPAAAIIIIIIMLARLLYTLSIQTKQLPQVPTCHLDPELKTLANFFKLVGQLILLSFSVFKVKGFFVKMQVYVVYFEFKKQCSILHNWSRLMLKGQCHEIFYPFFK